ncbi:MAG: ferritin [Candidatus Omnitrophica bacterium]|nr:ferritin [Candidatus Omnitrophota bacterium]
MMDKKLEKELNQQLNKELYSAYLYLAMAAYFEAENLSGFSHWMQIQAKEETSHAMKFFSYLNERGLRVILEAIDKPPVQFSSAEDVFKKSLQHEQKVTASINNLYTIAQKVEDNATKVFLQWFINEQVEEEKSVTEILSKLKYIDEQPAGILMLDKELGARG